MEQHTPGPWKAKAHGGDSTVLATVKPVRNDLGIPGYGYRDDAGHCIGYPFRDQPGEVRFDFVCFSHADARLIAAAPDLLAAAKKAVAWFPQDSEWCAPLLAAIAKAEGK